MKIFMQHSEIRATQSMFSELSTTYQPLMHHLFKKNYNDQIDIFEEKRASYAPLTPSPIILRYINIYIKR